MKIVTGLVLLSVIVVSNTAFAQGQRPPKTAAQNLSANFDYVHKQILDMAKDFPEDKYGFKLKPEMRSFGEVIVARCVGNHICRESGNGRKSEVG